MTSLVLAEKIICIRCRELHSTSDYRRHSRVCKVCLGIAAKSWSEKNKSEIREQRKKYCSTREARILRRLAHLRSKCLQKNIEFNLSVEDVLVPSHCPVLGVELNFNSHSPYCATVDRIKPELGYIKGNVVIVSKRANQIKSDASLEEMLKVTDYYRQIFNGN